MAIQPIPAFTTVFSKNLIGLDNIISVINPKQEKNHSSNNLCGIHIFSSFSIHNIKSLLKTKKVKSKKMYFYQRTKLLSTLNISIN